MKHLLALLRSPAELSWPAVQAEVSEAFPSPFLPLPFPSTHKLDNLLLQHNFLNTLCTPLHFLYIHINAVLLANPRLALVFKYYELRGVRLCCPLDAHFHEKPTS